MKNRRLILLHILLLASLGLSACGANLNSLLGQTVQISIVYGSEKQSWLEPLIQTYNTAHHKTADGKVIEVQGTVLGSIEAVNGIIAGNIQATVWSPASSIYIPVANAEWKKNHTTDLVQGTPKDLVLSPVVIAMCKPMAEALGWPKTALGWADIAKLATSPDGWKAYNYPEWGSFKFGHTHPGYSNSGLTAILAEAYAGSGKTRGLTTADLQDPKLQSFVSNVESSIIHYGTSTGFFATRMFDRGPSYLSAAVLYESSVVAQESKRLDGSSSQLPVVAIYPKEGTFWANHPYIILNAPWVTPAQAAAAADFETYLLDKPQQLNALEQGFRPSDPSIALAAPLDAQHGVDTAQPQTVLEIPSADVIQGAEGLWQKTKRTVDLVAVLDISGSMQGEKIAAARTSLASFINLLDPRDQLEVIIFNDKILTLSPLSTVSDKRDDLTRRISGITEGGGTSLYDSVAQAYDDLQAKGDPKHIRGLVVLTDGQDTNSQMSLDDLMSHLGSKSEEGGNAIKLFTIAFGTDADKTVLKQLAESTGGQEYDSDPKNIGAIYAEIATFF